MVVTEPVATGDNRDELLLAHLSDPHLTSLYDIQWRELANKRVLGYLSWLMGRKHRHQSVILDALLNDLQEIRPDHVVVTGDLTHIGTCNEYRQAKQWLGRAGTPDKVTVIPGNHDLYAPSDQRETLDQWLPYMQGEIQEHQDRVFPALRCRGSVALVGLSSAVPTAPFMATGRLGDEQLKALDMLLASLANRNLFRIILIHHGPLPGTNSYRRRLVDADDLISILKSRGAELVLHGHGHRNVEGLINTPELDIPVIGVASASIRSARVSKNATYNLFRISRKSGGWMIKLCFRSYNPYTCLFEEGAAREIYIEQLNKA